MTSTTERETRKKLCRFGKEKRINRNTPELCTIAHNTDFSNQLNKRWLWPLKIIQGPDATHLGIRNAWWIKHNFSTCE